MFNIILCLIQINKKLLCREPSEIFPLCPNFSAERLSSWIDRAPCCSTRYYCGLLRFNIKFGTKAARGQLSSLSHITNYLSYKLKYTTVYSFATLLKNSLCLILFYSEHQWLLRKCCTVHLPFLFYFTCRTTV